MVRQIMMEEAQTQMAAGAEEERTAYEMEQARPQH